MLRTYCAVLRTPASRSNWVNDVLGQPFFAVSRPIDHGLLEALKSDIVPRLLKEVPGQPSAAELEADRYRVRFVILFDRQWNSPEFFKEMWQTHRIACATPPVDTMRGTYSHARILRTPAARSNDVRSMARAVCSRRRARREDKPQTFQRWPKSERKGLRRKCSEMRPW